MNIHTVMVEMLEENIFWKHPENPFTAHAHQGDPNVMFVAGDNGSGKSLLVEYFRGWAKHHAKASTMCVSIRERVGGGLDDMAGMKKTFMFGDETEQSTGATSVSVAERAFTSLKTWCEESPDKDFLMVLDEPEIGLSHAYASAMGQHLAKCFQDVGSSRANLIVVTHNQALAKAFTEQRHKQPAFVHMGQSSTFDEWLQSTRLRTVPELLTMQQQGHENRKVVWRIEREITDAMKRQQAEDEANRKPKKRLKP